MEHPSVSTFGWFFGWIPFNTMKKTQGQFKNIDECWWWMWMTYWSKLKFCWNTLELIPQKLPFPLFSQVRYTLRVECLGNCQTPPPKSLQNQILMMPGTGAVGDAKKNVRLSRLQVLKLVAIILGKDRLFLWPSAISWMNSSHVPRFSGFKWLYSPLIFVLARIVHSSLALFQYLGGLLHGHQELHLCY